MNPELYEFVSDRLFKAGADDVYYTNIIMKKSRPAIKFSVLCKDNKLKILQKLILTETTTFGLRTYEVEKTEMERSFSEKQTKYGKVRIKMGLLEGKIIKSKPEYEDCKKLAIENHVPISEIYTMIGSDFKD
jgi:uncharacterized protein (DUF111 family)